FFLAVDTPVAGTSSGAGVFAGQLGAASKDRMMLGRHVYRVQSSEAGWIVIKEGEERPRPQFDGREAAIAEAVRLAGSDQPAKVIVDNGDGTIIAEWLFGSDLADELGA